jgi:hypothetical protein
MDEELFAPLAGGFAVCVGRFLQGEPGKNFCAAHHCRRIWNVLGSVCV